MKRCPQCPEVYSDMMHFCPNDGRQLVAIAAQDPLINVTIDGKYMIEAVIGRGGMGVVYRARHTNFNRQFAIKVLKSELVNDPQAVKRFRNEANAAGAIRHPNAIQISDFNITADGIAYLVMEYVEGRSLREILKKEGPISYARTVNLMTQVCDAVAAAHQKGIIHRDLKPDNIMVDEREGIVKEEVVHVLDFGIAKLSQNPAYSENITVGGAILGSPYYMSPEQCDGRQLDPRSDIYSIGIILYEMLAGKVPFRAQTPWGLVKMHCSTAPQPLRIHRPDIPPILEEVVLRALAKDPNDRQQSSVELGRELEAAIGGGPRPRTRSDGNFTVEAPVVRPNKGNLPTAPLDNEMAQQILEPSANEIISKPPLPTSAINGPLSDRRSLSTKPMPAVTRPQIEAASSLISQDLASEAGYNTEQQATSDAIPAPETVEAPVLRETSIEERKLEELAKELEAEISQLRVGRRDNSGSLPRNTPTSRPEALESFAKELSQELEQFDPKKAAQSTGSDVRRRTTGDDLSISENDVEGVAPITRRSPPVAPTSPINVAASSALASAAADVYENIPVQVAAATVEPFDLAEEFSLALPEMVEDVVLSVSETITLKSEVLAKKAAEQAAILASIEAKEKDKTAQLPTNVKRGKKFSSKSKPASVDASVAAEDRNDRNLDRNKDRSLDRSWQPAPGMVSMNSKSSAEFKTQLIKIVIASLGLIIIISAVLYYTNRTAPRPRGPQPRPLLADDTTNQPVVTGNDSGPPVDMVLIKGGAFLMGRDSDEPYESPAHEINVKPFYMDQFEVTNRRYLRFIEATGHAVPPQWQNGKYPPDQDDFPVVGVNWQDAIEFCEWRSRTEGKKYRLPTEAEWEFAARNGGNLLYPWGDKWVAEAANVKGIRNGLVKVNSMSKGISLLGISDLIGNAAEWTSDNFTLYPNSRAQQQGGDLKIVRGGHYKTAQQKATATYREWRPPTGGDYSLIGFRCVLEP
ncbi:MAG: bifunctional serine/threonine-protein kinase/formylglycine-generating enzyme family protein [Acidobacteriota bacterium]